MRSLKFGEGKYFLNGSPRWHCLVCVTTITMPVHFMRFRCTVMEISSIPNYLVYSIKRFPTPKVNKLQSPKLRRTQSLLVATFTQDFMRFCCTVMEISSIPNYLVYSIKRLPTPKVNKLQSPKLRLTQWLHSLRISCDSAARYWRNAIKTFHHTVVCVTTVTMPVHLHGTNFAPFLLLARRCYDAETSAILILLKRAFE